jgi:hypothetical protein
MTSFQGMTCALGSGSYDGRLELATGSSRDDGSSSCFSSSPGECGWGAGGEATSNPLALDLTVAICVSIVGTFPRLDAASSSSSSSSVAANPFEF